MKRLMTLTAVFLLSVLLAMPSLAAQSEQKAPTQPPEQAQNDGTVKTPDEARDPHQSPAFKRQQTYQEKREAMKQRRDEALKIRERNVNSNNPGKTGL